MRVAELIPECLVPVPSDQEEGRHLSLICLSGLGAKAPDRAIGDQDA